MSDEEKRVGVTGVFTESEPLTCEMTLPERVRLHAAYLANVKSNDSTVKGGAFEI